MCFLFIRYTPGHVFYHQGLLFLHIVMYSYIMRRVLYHLFMRSPSIWLHVFLCFVPLLHWVMFSSIWSSVFFSHTDHVFFQLVMWSSTLSCDLPPGHVFFHLVIFIQDICFSTSAGHVCRLHKPSSLFLIARPHERDFIRAGEKTRGSEASTEDGFGELV